jgi:hypothetical protein
MHAAEIARVFCKLMSAQIIWEQHKLSIYEETYGWLGKEQRQKDVEVLGHVHRAQQLQQRVQRRPRLQTQVVRAQHRKHRLHSIARPAAHALCLAALAHHKRQQREHLNSNKFVLIFY